MVTAVALAATVTVAALAGIWLRPVGWLSSFWPANALLLGIFIRLPRSRTLAGWCGAIVGYLCADLVTGGPLGQTLCLTAANLAGVAAGVAVFGRRPRAVQLLQQPQGVLEMFVTCGVAAGAASIIGLYCGVQFFDLSITHAASTWFTAEFASYLALLPVLLAAPSRRSWRRFLARRRRRTDTWWVRALGAGPTAGVVATLLLGIAIGGPAALAFSVPVLLWSATRGNVFQTACLVLLATAWTLTAAGLGYLDLRYTASAGDHLLAVQIGMSLSAMGPLMVAVSSRARERMIREWEGLATHDELTGLLSRRGFMSGATAALARLQNESATCAVLMLDLDHFKLLNDRFGHAAGDRVLAEVAAALTRSVRESDLLGRLGGEEFVLLLEHVTAQQAAEIGEHLRAATASLSVPVGDASAARVTMSIGLAHTDLGSSRDDLTALLLRADHALYAAKREGRNRVAVAP